MGSERYRISALLVVMLFVSMAFGAIQAGSPTQSNNSPTVNPIAVSGSIKGASAPNNTV